MLNEFIEYLAEQIGQPYLWGGQHTRLTPETYEVIIHKREGGRGKYPDGTTYADASIAYCKKLFDAGAAELYAYDCSGLGMFWLQTVKHIYDHDANANTLMGRCSNLGTADPPEKGWWCFITDSNGKATHIGYMVDNNIIVEAKGRKFGVVESKWAFKNWSIWGIPDVFYEEIVNPEPQPDPPEPPEPAEKYVEVIGGSVRVRASDSVFGKKLFTAHRGDRFPYIGTSPSGWYQIFTGRGDSYITSKPKYTRLIET